MIKSLNKRPNSLTAFRANWAIRKSALDQRILIGKKVARNWLKHSRSFARKRVEQQDSKKSPIESFSLLAVTFAMALPLRSDYVNGFVHQPSLSGPPVDLIENCYSRPLSFFLFQPDLLLFHTAAYTIDRSPSYATRRPAITESIVSTRRPGFCRAESETDSVFCFRALPAKVSFSCSALCMQNQLLGMLCFLLLLLCSSWWKHEIARRTKAFNLYFSLLCATFFFVCSFSFLIRTVHNHETERENLSPKLCKQSVVSMECAESGHD